MKIPPKILFSVQLTATLVSALTQIAVLNWMFIYIPSLCADDAINGFTCPIARVHFNGKVQPRPSPSPNCPYQSRLQSP